jgi:hypothetical protein
VSGAFDDRRKLASLILAEALVFGSQRGSGNGSSGSSSKQGPQEEDLSAIVTWIIRAVPVATSKVSRSHALLSPFHIPQPTSRTSYLINVSGGCIWTEILASSD